MRGGPSSSSKSGLASNSSNPPDGEGGSLQGSSLAAREESSRRSGNSFLKSLTWSLTSETRNLAALLCQAAIAGNIKWIENLLDEGAYVDGWTMDDDEKYTPLKAKRNSGNRVTPLMLAVKHKRTEAFQLLLDRGADLGAKDSQGLCVWHYIVNHDLDLRIRLIQSNRNPPLDSLYYLLPQAIDAERVDVLKLLLKRASRRHANAECKIRSGISDKVTDATILWMVVEKKNLDIVGLLVDKGANIDERVRILAIQGWDLGNKSLELRARNGNDGPTPLFSVVGDTRRLDLAKYLVSVGASVTAKTGECCVRPGDGRGVRQDVTLLHMARGQSAEFLVSKGANVFARDSLGQTPLFWAIWLWPEPDPVTVLANLAQGPPPKSYRQKVTFTHRYFGKVSLL